MRFQADCELCTKLSKQGKEYNALDLYVGGYKVATYLPNSAEVSLIQVLTGERLNNNQ